MSKEAETSFMGPALFVGLTLYMLATGKPAEQEVNPQREMKLLAAQTQQAPADESYTPLQSITPLSPQPRLAMSAIVPFPTDEASLRIPSALPKARVFALSTQLSGAPSAALGMPVAALPAAPNDPEARQSSRWLALPRVADQAPRSGRRKAKPPSQAAAAYAVAPKPLAAHQPSAELPAAPLLPDAIITAQAVHLRQQPSARSGILAKMARGTSLKMLGKSGNWIRVFAPGTTPQISGWIYRDYIEVASELQNSES